MCIRDRSISIGDGNIVNVQDTGDDAEGSLAIGRGHRVVANNAAAIGNNIILGFTQDNVVQLGGSDQEAYLGRATANDDGDLAIVTKDYADDASEVAEIQIIGFPDILTVYIDEDNNHRLEWDTAQITVQRGDTRLDYTTAAGDPSACLLYTSPSPRDRTRSRMPSSA